jgi:hypothetical protein
VTRKNDEASRQRLEEAARERPEPRFGRQRTRKNSRSPGRLRGQRLLFETEEQGRLWGVQRKEGQK